MVPCITEYTHLIGWEGEDLIYSFMGSQLKERVKKENDIAYSLFDNGKALWNMFKQIFRYFSNLVLYKGMHKA